MHLQQLCSIINAYLRAPLALGKLRDGEIKGDTSLKCAPCCDHFSSSWDRKKRSKELLNTRKWKYSQNILMTVSRCKACTALLMKFVYLCVWGKLAFSIKSFSICFSIKLSSLIKNTYTFGMIFDLVWKRNKISYKESWPVNLIHEKTDYEESASYHCTT